jgi:hypothetical protein
MRTAAARRRFAVSAMLVGMIFAFGDVGRAVAQSRCQSLKFKAAGAVAKRKATCHARAAKDGTAVDAACLAGADDQLARKWVKAETAGDCVTTDDATDGVSSTDQCLAAIEAVVDPPPPPTSPCCNFVGSCAHPVDETTCVSVFGGTAGPPGSVCDGTTGTCGAPPAGPGQCCMTADAAFCTAGPNLDLGGCVPPQFIDAPSGICDPSGACVLP